MACRRLSGTSFHASMIEPNCSSRRRRWPSAGEVRCAPVVLASRPIFVLSGPAPVRPIQGPPCANSGRCPTCARSGPLCDSPGPTLARGDGPVNSGSIPAASTNRSNLRDHASPTPVVVDPALAGIRVVHGARRSCYFGARRRRARRPRLPVTLRVLLDRLVRRREWGADRKHLSPRDRRSIPIENVDRADECEEEADPT